MQRILVTGGLGFIGSHTVDLLIEKGYSVIVIDNLEKQVHNGVKPKYKNPKAEYIRGDIRNRKTWEKALDGTDGIIHLAGAVGIAQSFWQAKKYMDVNTSSTALMYEQILKLRSEKNQKYPEKIVVASSKSLYGEGLYECKIHGIKSPDVRPIEQLKKHEWETKCDECGADMKPIGITENKFPQNLNPYSLSKYATERLSMDFSYTMGIDTVAFRYFNVYGERQSLSNPYTGVMAIFLSRLKNNHQPFLFEDGKQLRDYIYVKDVARMNVMALEKGNGVYNLGTGKPLSLLGVVKLLNKNLGTDIQPKISEEFRPGDNRHDYANTEKLNHDFGSTNFVDVEKGVGNLIQWSLTEKSFDKFEKQEKERKKYLAR
ncbi:MAG: NAD-dependent epimerase/dehydratase [Thermoplasmatales archaeon E-plasma]|nr:MAG: NAD-dependent epimerase/dehydratase [Thermoplasmatales archaeon E-plasma]